MDKEEIQTKDRILKKAFELFIRDGYDKTPIQAIIHAVGIAKGTFYHHFRSKDDMLLALVENLTQMIAIRAAEIRAHTEWNSREKLIRLFEESASLKLERLDQSIVLIRRLRSGGNERLLGQLRELSIRISRPLLGELIAEGVREGVFRVGDPDATALIVIGISWGIQDEASDLLLAAWEGDDAALDQLVGLLSACEEAIGRILGLQDGSLPIYKAETFKERLIHGRNRGGHS